MIKIRALMKMIESGTKKYPIYLALMRAKEIHNIAAVPNYRESTTNADIARNVANKPVKEWQRPPIPKKIHDISQLFNDTGEFMPNPILIAQNPHTSVPPTVDPYISGDNDTSVWELRIDQPDSESEKPLWILDGQHRINGLAQSAQSSNPVPVVFLLNQGSYFYSADILAKIFAQVTTAATPLGKLHDEWLSYAFELKHYSPQHLQATAQTKSMATVVSLCMHSSFDGVSNPFYDHIQYNDRLPPSRILPGGHVYTCIELKDIIYRSYYSDQKHQPELVPADLAKQMSRARGALASVIRTPSKRSVFFGDESHHQKIMEDAFWCGILKYIATHGAPPSWRGVLTKLYFDSTDWDFSWKVSLHGRDQTTSKNLAIKVMRHIFSERSLPKGNDSIADLLRGNGAKFEIEAFQLTLRGRPSRREAKVLEVRRGDTRSFPIARCVAIRLQNPSLNIQNIRVTDKQAPPGTLVEYRDVLKKAGMKLEITRHNNPLQLLFTLYHYGGETSTADVKIDWQP